MRKRPRIRGVLPLLVLLALATASCARLVRNVQWGHEWTFACDDPIGLVNSLRGPEYRGQICGVDALVAYGLSDEARQSNLLRETCSRLGGGFDYYTCTLEIPFDQLIDGEDFLFCEGQGSQPQPAVVLEIIEPKQHVANPKRPGPILNELVFSFDWRLEGRESCRRHGAGHEVALGLAYHRLSAEGNEYGALQTIRSLYGSTWAYVHAGVHGKTAKKVDIYCLTDEGVPE